MARPEIVWTDEQYKMFERLCFVHCTQEDICLVMDVSDKTLNRLLYAHYKKRFSECFKKFSAGGRISLRKKQFEVALSGNVPMLIWLGKQTLGQTERQEQANADTLETSKARHTDLVAALKDWRDAH